MGDAKRIEVSLELDLSALERLISDVDSGRGQVERGWKEVALVYRSFILRRFRNYSRGGGDWPALSSATIRAKGSSVILIDTGLMIAAINPVFSGVPGQLEELHSDRLGITVGFKQDSHSQSSNITIADIAAIHHLGLGRVPPRQIIVEPDTTTMKQMARAMESHIYWQGGDNTGGRGQT